MKLYTEEQLRNSMNSVRYYIENYNESVIDSMIEKHIKALGGIEFISDIEIEKHSNNNEMKTTKQTPLSDLEKSALKHYDEASTSIHHWNSDIPNAIKFYYKWRQLNFWGRLKLIFNTKEK